MYFYQTYHRFNRNSLSSHSSEGNQRRPSAQNSIGVQCIISTHGMYVCSATSFMLETSGTVHIHCVQKQMIFVAKL